MEYFNILKIEFRKEIFANIKVVSRKCFITERKTLVQIIFSEVSLGHVPNIVVELSLPKRKLLGIDLVMRYTLKYETGNQTDQKNPIAFE